MKISTAYPYEGTVKVKIENTPQARTAFAFFKPSWTGETTVVLNGKVVTITEKDHFIYVNPTLKVGDTLVYTFNQEPYLAPTHNMHTIKGYQKVYQGPLLLGTMAKKEVTLPRNVKLFWHTASKTAVLKPGNVRLTPINDIIDNMYNHHTYKRQVLWKKYRFQRLRKVNFNSSVVGCTSVLINDRIVY